MKGDSFLKKMIDVLASSFYSVGVERPVLYAVRYKEGVGGIGIVS